METPLDGACQTCSNGKAVGSAAPPQVVMNDTSPLDEMHNADGSVREPQLIPDHWRKEQPAGAPSLRAASAHRSYQHVYHDRHGAWNIAGYLSGRITSSAHTARPRR